MDPTRRNLLTTGAAVAVAAAAPSVFAQQQTGKGEPTGRFYERGSVRIHYEDTGSGYPLLLIPGGGHNATIEWNASRAPFKIPLAVRHVRTFLQAHRPATA